MFPLRNIGFCIESTPQYSRPFCRLWHLKSDGSHTTNCENTVAVFNIRVNNNGFTEKRIVLTVVQQVYTFIVQNIVFWIRNNPKIEAVVFFERPYETSSPVVAVKIIRWLSIIRRVGTQQKTPNIVFTVESPIR